MADEQSGFLGRWARRKTDVLQGKPLQEPAIAEAPAAAAAGVAGASPSVPPQAASDSQRAPDAAQPAEQILSLEDVKTLTQDSDFKPFMARNVGPDVRNAAMKKLFADPQFNVMDGLDIYIDDYSKSDPIPESMLRKMVGAKLLNLFDDEPDELKKSDDIGQSVPEASADAGSGVAFHPNHADPETVAQSQDYPELDSQDSLPANFSSQPASSQGSDASQHDHANSHLRLQPDHAPPAPDAGRGT